jgi:hypothetical protein
MLPAAAQRQFAVIAFSLGPERTDAERAAPADPTTRAAWRRRGRDMTRRHISLLAIALFASGCATTAPDKTAEAGKQVCTRVEPTGSLRPMIRCRSATEIMQEEADAERTLGFVRQTSPETPR